MMSTTRRNDLSRTLSRERFSLPTAIAFPLVAFLLATLLIFPLSCGKKEAGEIKIGVILPLSGDGASYGQKEKNGVILAIEEANARSSKKIEAIYEDSQGLPAPAAAAAQKLISSDKVPVIIGGAFSSPTLAVVPIADKSRVVVMSPSASSPKLSGSSKYFFRVWPSDVSEASVMADVAINRMGLSTFAILYGNNEYGLGLKTVFDAKVQELGKRVLAVDTYNEGDSDFRAQLTKIKSLKPEAIYLGGYYREFAKILQQAREMGIKAQFLSCGTFHEPEIITLAGGAAEGVVFVQPYFDRQSTDSVTRAFVQTYEKRFNVEAGVYAAHAYDAAMVICEMILAGKTTAYEIQQGLLALKNFPGVTGKTTFIEGGDVIKPARVMIVRNGAFVDYVR
jgi:branched-chain amino acid transport system substrate-binding protein